MRPRPLAVSLLVLTLAGLAGEGRAQLVVPRAFELTLFAGGAAFGDFHEHSVHIHAPGGPVGQPWRRSITARPGSSAGAAVTYWLSPVWGVRAHMSTSSTRFAEYYERDALGLLRDDPVFAARGELAPLRVRYRDVTLVFRVPGRVGEISAYALLGIGHVRYDARPGNGRQLPPGTRDAFLEEDARDWALAGVGGLGAHYTLGRIRLIAEVTNHLARSPIRVVEPGEVFRSDALVIERPPPIVGDAQLGGGERVNNVRFVIGVSGSIGGG